MIRLVHAENKYYTLLIVTHYIYQCDNWPRFHWDEALISPQLAATRHRQGRFIGRMENLGFQLKSEAVLQSLTQDVLKSSEIEGEFLPQNQVRSSIARRLGLDIGGLIQSDRHVEGIVELMLDATQDYKATLTNQRLFSWHKSLFPINEQKTDRIIIGAWRDDARGAMQVISGAVGRKRVHFQAPDALALNREMALFLNWFNSYSKIDLVLKAALAHLWFVTIHPFDDGNGRIARAITDMVLARSEGSAQRFYSMSAQIQIERNTYYDMLESTQKGTCDITDWLLWFLGCLDRAFEGAEKNLDLVLTATRFWESYAGERFNDRQRTMLHKLLNGFFGKLTSSKWAKMMGCSQDTALRDIEDLVQKGVLIKDSAGGRSTSYGMVVKF